MRGIERGRYRIVGYALKELDRSDHAQYFTLASAFGVAVASFGNGE